MSKWRLPMRKIKEILRLKHENGLSLRKIGVCCNLNSSTVSDYLARAKIAGISWPISDDMDDETLENLLFPKNLTTKRIVKEPDFQAIRQELRKKGVTLQLLWVEYKELNSEGYQYSRFCELYQQWKKP
jgi:Transposase and inactivated derivatives